VKQEAWVEDKFDKVFTKKAKVVQTDKTKQNTESALTTNNYANIIKIPNVFVMKDKFEKDDEKMQNAESTR
jgi:hypothetical protein